MDTHQPTQDSSIIFYGAGQYAERNLARWISNGLNPVCFADNDKGKWHTLFAPPSCDASKALEILPLSEAVEMYPDYEIYVTVGLDRLEKVVDFLKNEKNIPQYRIKFPDAMEYRLGCTFLGSKCYFGGDEFYTCCHPKTMRVRYSNPENCVSEYSSFFENIIERQKKNEPTFCDGCHMQSYGLYPIKPTVEAVSFDSYYNDCKCNFRCSYCSPYDFFHGKERYGLLEVMTPVLKYFENNPPYLFLASGEITLHKKCEQILEMLEQSACKCGIFTNASIYNDRIAQMLQSGQAKIQVSLDCGTRETFAEIKGVDCFEKVCDNLVRYASKAPKEAIQMKYIFMPDINDDERNIGGFVSLADSINACCIISSDSFQADTPLPISTVSAMRSLANKLEARAISYSYVKEYFNKETISQIQ